MKAEHQGVPASQLPSLGCDCLLCKLPRQGMWNQFSNGREYHCFSWVPLKSRAWGCTINTLGMIESFVWPDLFSRTVLTFCPGVCKASSVSTPGGNNSMAFSFLHNPPETTPDSSGNPGVQSFTSLPPECGGYSTLPSVTTDQQGWLGGGRVSLLSYCSVHATSWAAGQTDRGPGWKKMTFSAMGGTVFVKAEGVIVFPARISSSPWASVSWSIKQGD